MSSDMQALFFGLALAMFAVAVIISLIQSDANNRITGLNWTALGLAFWVFVPFILALRSS